jgi:RNA-directed DNA polymerase
LRLNHSLQGEFDFEGQASVEASRRDPDENPTEHLIERILDPANIEKAMRKVMSNKGSAGVDGVLVSSLPQLLERTWPEVQSQILEGRYRPQPVLRKTIPKPNGGERELGIPTALDRVIQQAILQILSPLLDPSFSEHSYGFRPGKNAHQAIEAVRSYIGQGYVWVVDLDLEKFFDRVNHDVLMNRLARRIRDKRLLRLIRGFLNSGVMAGGVVSASSEGTPQGGPLSPLLSNLLLDELDKELESRGLHFARYADDCNIYVKSEQAGHRVMASVTRFLEVKLRLKVNQAKSAVARPSERRFLGFRLSRFKDSAQVVVHPSKLLDFKHRVRTITARYRGISAKSMVLELSVYLRGWGGYYGRSVTSGARFEMLDSWIRRRVRQYLWVQWKTQPNRARHLMRGGIDPREAKRTSWISSPWRASHNSWVEACLNNRVLKRGGLVSLKDLIPR